MWPIARTLFPWFFPWSLAARIAERSEDAGVAVSATLQQEGILLSALMLVSHLLDNLAGREETALSIVVLAWVAIVPLVVLKLRLQVAANAVCGDPDGAGNASLSVWNRVFIGIGAGLWGLMALLVGLALLA